MIEIALDLYITLRKMAILTILILLIEKYRISLHLGLYKFLSVLFNSFYCIGIKHVLLNLFLRISYFQMLS